MTDPIKPTRKPPYVRPAGDYPDIGLDFLHARCTDSDGCLLWRQRMQSGPVANIGGRAWKMRHVVYRLVHPRGPGRSHLPMPTVCGNDRCLHPDHLLLVKRNAAVAGTRRPLTHRRAIALTKRERSGKLTAEQATEIRASADTLTALAARYGINVSLVHRIKAGTSWRDYASPFALLVEALK